MQWTPLLQLNLKNYQIDDKRISRTMITLYNRTEQYEKSMKLLVPMRNDSWKKNERSAKKIEVFFTIDS